MPESKPEGSGRLASELAQRFRVGDWTVHPVAGSMERRGEAVHLPPRVMELLVYLASRAGEVVSKEELFDTVWTETFVEDVALARAISDLRKALGDDAREPRYIETLPKRGYRLIAPLTAASSRSPSGPPPAPAGRVWSGVAVRSRVAFVAVLVLAVIVVAGFAWWLASGPRQEASPAAERRIRSLAVLPLRQLSDDPDQAYFSEGMTDQLITDLARVGSFDVVSATSARTYMGSSQPLPAIARELGVDAVVEGTIQRSGRRVLINVQLIDGESDRHLWADRYEGDLDDVFALQIDVAQAIAREVAEALEPQEVERLLHRRQVSREVYEAYLRGRHFWTRLTPDAVRKSLEHFARALELDPSFAPAHAGLADAYSSMGWYAWMPPPTAYALARRSAERALELDPTLAQAHTALALVKVANDRDWSAGLDHLRQAVELAPHDAWSHLWYADILTALGHFDEALAEIERALAVDPLSPLAGTVKAVLFEQMGRPEEAIRQLERILEMVPGFVGARLELCNVYNVEGLYEQTLATCGGDLDGEGFLAAGAVIGWAHARSGREREAREILERLTAANESLNAVDGFEDVLALAIATVHMGLGDEEQTLAWLERAVAGNPSFILGLKINPYFRTLHGEPGFTELLRRLAPG